MGGPLAHLYWPAYDRLPHQLWSWRPPARLPLVIAEFDWWLLIVGFVAGGGLIWLILARLPRTDEDVSLDERWSEAGWIAEELAATGRPIDRETADEVLALHRRYVVGADSEPFPGEDEVEGDEPQADRLEADRLEADQLEAPAAALQAPASAVAIAGGEPGDPRAPEASSGERSAEMQPAEQPRHPE